MVCTCVCVCVCVCVSSPSSPTHWQSCRVGIPQRRCSSCWWRTPHRKLHIYETAPRQPELHPPPTPAHRACVRSETHTQTLTQLQIYTTSPVLPGVHTETTANSGVCVWLSALTSPVTRYFPSWEKAKALKGFLKHKHTNTVKHHHSTSTSLYVPVTPVYKNM